MDTLEGEDEKVDTLEEEDEKVDTLEEEYLDLIIIADFHWLGTAPPRHFHSTSTALPWQKNK